MSKLDDLTKKVAALKKGGEKKVAQPEQKPVRKGGHPTKTLPVISNAEVAEITDKEEIFCQAVVAGKSDTDAYKEAYSTERMKPVSINRMAHRLRQKVKITSRIAFLRQEATRAAVITESQVLAEAARIGFSDPRKLFDDDGNILPVKQWSDALAAAVKSIKVTSRKTITETDSENHSVITETAVVEVAMWDKNSALEKLFKHMGLYEKDNKQRNPFAEGFSRLPVDAQRLIAERLQAIAGPIVSGQPNAGAGSRVTH